jgi:hypothetical protein
MIVQASTLVVAGVWFTHGLYNKLLGGSPRHLAIVQAVPGLHGAAGDVVLQIVGLFEVAVALWVLWGRAPYVCAAAQTVALLSMNLVELTFARDLLLWPEALMPVNLVFLGLAWTAAASRRGATQPPAIRPPLRARARRHPIPIEARLEHCLTLTYALPAGSLRPLLPRGLRLDTWGDLGFVAVALVQTRSLRPAGLPEWLGRDFFLAGYRVFTRLDLPDGRSLRGLRILRSDADRVAMVTAGNLLTHYNYHRCRARLDVSQGTMDVVVQTSDGTGDLHVSADLTGETLPPGSPFSTVREARRFAGPMPFTFDCERETGALVTIRANRTNWTPTLVRVDAQRIAFFDALAFKGCTPILAAAFHVRNVDYRWERGVVHVPAELAAEAQA